MYVVSRASFDAIPPITLGLLRVIIGGATLWLAGAGPEVLAVIRRSQLAGALGTERLLFNVEAAVAKYDRSAVAHRS